MSNISAGQLLNENELASGEIIATAPAPEEIQMDTNGDGIVDKLKVKISQQLLVTLFSLKRSRWIQTVMV